MGSAALELAYTACGRQGGYFEVYLNPWDYAAGILLVEEAGGKVTDWIENKLNPRQGNQVIGTNGNIHQELLRILPRKNWQSVQELIRLILVSLKMEPEILL